MPTFANFTYLEKSRHFGAAEVNQHIRSKSQQLLKKWAFWSGGSQSTYPV
jgi:hypothetical protein